MKRRILALLSLVALTLVISALCSCSNSTKNTGKVYILSVASDYVGTGIKNLVCPANDQAAFVEQFNELIPDAEIYFYRLDRTGSPTAGKNPRFRKLSKTTNEDLYELVSYDSADGMISKSTKINNKDFWNTSDVQLTISKLSIIMEKDDLLIFHYSGHGNTDDGRIITNYQNGKYDYGLPAEDFVNLFRNTEGLALVIMDSCYSGNYSTEGTLSDGLTFYQYTSNGSPVDSYLKTSLVKSISNSFQVLFSSPKSEYDTNGVYILSACTANQVANDNAGAIETNAPNKESFGLISYLVLESLGYDFENLKAQNQHKKISIYSIYNHVWSRLRSIYKTDQTPLVTLSPLDVVIAE